MPGVSSMVYNELPAVKGETIFDSFLVTKSIYSLYMIPFNFTDTLRDNKHFRTAKILDVGKFQENPRTNVLLSHFQVSGPVLTAKSGRWHQYRYGNSLKIGF